MDSRLTLEAVEVVVAERRREAELHRLAARGRPAHPGDEAADVDSAEVTVRLASSDDAASLDRLSQLDSAERPRGPILVAEQRGQLAAALPLDGGRPVADPFRPTGDLVRLLELRAEQLKGAPRGRLLRLLPARLQPRAAER